MATKLRGNAFGAAMSEVRAAAILMLLSVTLNGLACVVAFPLLQRPVPPRRPFTTTQLHLDRGTRRDFFTCGIVAAVALGPRKSNADVDYSRIQDLLGPGGDYATTYQPSNTYGASKRPTYLTEPTEEFKQSEEKAMEFKRKNMQITKQFSALLDAVGTVPNDETVLANTLDEVRRLIKKNKGLPTGITKDDIVKICRRRKAKKYWPTTVEIAYQDLLIEIIYQQSPNTDRDTSFL